MTTTTQAPAPPAPIKVVALSGSVRAGSFTRKVLGVALEGVKKLGAEVTLVDLAQWRLPPFDGGPSSQEPDAARFKAAVKEADGLLVATPVYHDSYSGMLKNAFDHLDEELREKVAALVCVGGGKVGQGQALEHLRAVLRETGTWVLPRQAVLSSSEQAFDEQGQLKDKQVETRLFALGEELVLRCRTLRPRKRG